MLAVWQADKITTRGVCRASRNAPSNCSADTYSSPGFIHVSRCSCSFTVPSGNRRPCPIRCSTSGRKSARSPRKSASVAQTATLGWIEPPSRSRWRMGR